MPDPRVKGLESKLSRTRGFMHLSGPGPCSVSTVNSVNEITQNSYLGELLNSEGRRNPHGRGGLMATRS